MKHLLIMFVFLGFFQPILGQETDEIDAFLDDFFASENQDIEALLAQLNSNFIYFSSSFQSKTYFSGRDYDVDQFRFSPQLSYYFSNGWAISYNANYYSQSQPAWDNQNIGISYTKKIPKSPLGFMGNFSRSMYAQSQYTDANYLSLGAFANESNYLYGAGIYYSVGGSSFANNQMAANAYYKFTLIKNAIGKITFRPELNVLWGNYDYEVQSGKGMQAKWITLNEFSKINTMVRLPIHYYGNSIDLTLEYDFNFPTLLKSESSVSNSSYIGISLGYFLSL